MYHRKVIQTSTNDSIIEEAIKRGQTALSEDESKLLLKNYGVTVTREKITKSKEEAVSAAVEIGYPVVLKASGSGILHKTEKNLVVVDLRNDEEVKTAFDTIQNNLGNEPGNSILVQQMVRGERELVIGLVRDPQFGPCVMFGLGGIFTEVLKDTSFRMAPITEREAMEMMDDIRASEILGPVRGLKPVNKDLLAK
ncbi:MAG: acetate--CoA ligase family protein, partial [Actinobacteria bacterium]|nr:acetate--CoA ligase family protein [Actinomycetota bacterium]